MDRNKEIVKLRKEGKSYAAIGKVFNISPTRVRDIYRKVIRENQLAAKDPLFVFCEYNQRDYHSFKRANVLAIGDILKLETKPRGMGKRTFINYKIKAGASPQPLSIKSKSNDDKEYTIIIREVLEKRVTVASNSLKHAIEDVTRDYDNGIHVLDSSNWVGTKYIQER